MDPLVRLPKLLLSHTRQLKVCLFDSYCFLTDYLLFLTVRYVRLKVVAVKTKKIDKPKGTLSVLYDSIESLSLSLVLFIRGSFL